MLNHALIRGPSALGVFLAALMVACTQGNCSAAGYAVSQVEPPSVRREIRAAWVASVANIDWPSTNNLTTAQQKGELVTILNRAADLRLNTIILQVRPACDALYPSSIEPWSEYLTGAMGKAPTPFYDPLAFAIEEAHKRGLELHAWFNPYRARQASAKSPIAPTHISRTHPEFVRQYGKSLWLDPGERGVQAYSLGVIMDVVKRYDIDGVHFDDYFYPYKEKSSAGKDLEFPDDASWQRFGLASRMSRDDWRRENVNTFVHRVYDSIKAAKPWVKFGISPFGIWRPGTPTQIQGQDAYATLYADSRQWLMKGWVDYFVPQLYWGIGQPAQSFPVLLNWWAEQNIKHRQLAPGMDATKVGRQWGASEILHQVQRTRSTPGVSGHVYWSIKALMRNGDWAAEMSRELYPQPALSPSLPWLSDRTPAKPGVTITGGSRRVNWKPGAEDTVRLWLVQTRMGGEWNTRLLPGSERMLTLAKSKPEIISVTAVDRFGNASAPTTLELGEGRPTHLSGLPRE